MKWYFVQYPQSCVVFLTHIICNDTRTLWKFFGLRFSKSMIITPRITASSKILLSFIFFNASSNGFLTRFNSLSVFCVLIPCNKKTVRGFLGSFHHVFVTAKGFHIWDNSWHPSKFAKLYLIPLRSLKLVNEWWLWKIRNYSEVQFLLLKIICFTHLTDHESKHHDHCSFCNELFITLGDFQFAQILSNSEFWKLRDIFISSS